MSARPETHRDSKQLQPALNRIPLERLDAPGNEDLKGLRLKSATVSTRNETHRHTTSRAFTGSVDQHLDTELSKLFFIWRALWMCRQEKQIIAWVPTHNLQKRGQVLFTRRALPSLSNLLASRTNQTATRTVILLGVLVFPIYSCMRQIRFGDAGKSEPRLLWIKLHY